MRNAKQGNDLNPNLDLLQTVKVTKSGYHLSHDRASKGYGLFLV